MYFLNTLVFLSSTLAAAHDGPHTNPSTARTCKAITPSIATTSPSARPVTTVFVTVTHTLSPANSPTISPSTTPSHVAIPTPTPENKQAEPDRPDSVPGLRPLVADPTTGESETRLPIFTLDSVLVLKSSASLSTHTHMLPSSFVLSAEFPDPVSHAASSAVFSSRTKGQSAPPGVSGPARSFVTTTPTTTPTTESEEEDAVMFVLPVGSAGRGEALPGFEWPGASEAEPLPSSAISHDSNDNSDVDYDDDKTVVNGDIAWAGTDNAIPAHMHDRSVRDRSTQDRTLQHFSPPPLQSESAATRRPRRVWRWHEERSDGKEFGKVEQDAGGGEVSEKRDCLLCEEEGKTACRGDVAIGMCKGGCVELRFLGRGKGNGCEDE